MRILRVICLVLAATLVAPGAIAEAKQGRAQSTAKAGKAGKAAKAGKAKPRARAARMVCKGTGKNRKCRKARRGFAGHTPPKSSLRTVALARPSGRVHLKDQFAREVDVNIYRADGSLDQAALASLDQLWQCRRTHEVRAVDPRLFETLSTIQDHFGKPITILSGFRYQENEGSRHFHASAMDITVEGVPYRALYAYVATLDGGNMGIGQYPHSGFVHIDFRAPGEGSYRWTDWGGRGARKAARGRRPNGAWSRLSTPRS